MKREFTYICELSRYIDPKIIFCKHTVNGKTLSKNDVISAAKYYLLEGNIPKKLTETFQNGTSEHIMNL